jgi:hypothetical protein
VSAPDVLVFVGPSLPGRSRTRHPRIRWLPPAAAGDVAALLDHPPTCLCLIDGFFQTRPAPWHKELMMLMARGTKVFGAASMGALRAAELDRHGMTGVGAIYRAYRDGRLTGDDEVALIHATERLGWAPLSVPLVEVRATLAAACRSRLIGVPQARRMRDEALALHFSDRDWPALRERWESQGVCEGRTAAAIAAHHVPLKRLDALACLIAALADTAPGLPLPPPPMTSFLRRLLRERSG